MGHLAGYRKDCREGSACEWLAIAPSGRYLHTAVLYKTWTHQDAYENMCGGDPSLMNYEACADYKEICHKNLTCLGGVDSYYSRQDIKGLYLGCALPM